MRWYWLDWYRIIAVNQIVFYHTIEGILSYRKKGPHLNEHINAIRTYMNCVGLPLFFVVSGMVKGLHNNRDYTLIMKRIQYLMIALVISVIVFWIPSVYINAIAHDGMYLSQCNIHDTEGNMVSFVSFEVYYFWTNCLFQVGFGWLWFLPTLCIIEILSIPFIQTIQNFRSMNSIQIKYIQFFINLAIMNLLYFGIFRKSVTQLWFIIIVIISHCILLIGIKIYFNKLYHERVLIRFVCLIFVIFGCIPISMICMMSSINIRISTDKVSGLKYQNLNDQTDYDLTYIFFWMFHLFGIVFTKIIHPQLNNEKLSPYIEYCTIILYQLAFILFFYATSIQTSTVQNMPYTFVNILEEPDIYQRIMYIVSCWLFLSLSSISAKHLINYNPNQYLKIITKYSFIVYCSHGLFIQIITYCFLTSKTNTSRYEIVWIYILAISVSYFFAFCVYKIRQKLNNH